MADRQSNDNEISLISRESIVLGRKEERKIRQFLRSPAISMDLQGLIEKYIENKVGKPWNDPAILQRLRRAIIAQKCDYWKEGSRKKVTYRKGYNVLSYLAYHLPVYFIQFQQILFTLVKGGLLKREMQVLDVGTGPGVISLSFIDFYRRLHQGRVTLSAIEVSEEQVEAYNYLVPEYVKYNNRITIKEPIKADLISLMGKKILDNFDMIVFSNVLNELPIPLSERAQVIRTFAKNLLADGSIVAIEPADLENSTALRKITINAIKGSDLNIYDPCSFLWGATCSTERCWTFFSGGEIQPTRLMGALASSQESYRFLNTDIKFTYAILRKDRKVRRIYSHPNSKRFSRLSKLHLHLNRRINVVVALMSGDVGDEKNHVFRICDGTSVKPVYAVLPNFHINNKNKSITKGAYGDIFELYNGLVRLNAAYDAYNILITRASMVRLSSS